MKKYIAGLLLILLAVSCNTKKEEELPVKNSDYISRPIGINKHGEYNIVDVDTIRQKWNADIKEKLELPDIALSNFKIIKISTQGDASETCYLLVANTPDGSASVGSILYLEGDKFYFETDKRRGQKSSQVIICKGRYGQPGCNPIVLLHNKEKYLICSSSDDCEKIASEVF